MGASIEPVLRRRQTRIKCMGRILFSFRSTRAEIVQCMRPQYVVKPSVVLSPRLMVTADLLASLTYSNRNKGTYDEFSIHDHQPPCHFPEFVRLGCDLMNFYFVYDEYTDVSDPVFAGKIASMVIEAMRHPDRCSPASHILVGMTQE